MQYRKFFERPDARLYTETDYHPDAVKNPYAALVVPGFPATVKQYEPLRSLLSKNGVVTLAFDPRYIGKSATINGGRFSIDGHVNDILALAAYVKNRYERPVVAIGHSFGSYLVCRAALEDEANLIDSVVLISALPSPHEYAMQRYQLYLRAMEIPPKIRNFLVDIFGWLIKSLDGGHTGRDESIKGIVHLRNYHGRFSELMDAISNAPDLRRVEFEVQKPVLTITALEDHVSREDTVAIFNKIAGTDINPAEIKSPMTIRDGNKVLKVLEKLGPVISGSSAEIIGKQIVGFVDEFAGKEAKRYEDALRT